MTFSWARREVRVAGRWGDPSAFRADPAATPAARPSRRQTVALVAVLLLVAGAVAVASYVIRPERARAFDLFHGSLFLADEQSPVAVDLASGKPTLRLVGAAKQVGITGDEALGVVPLDGGTLLLNRTTGEFNMVDSSGFVVKHDGGGVPLGTAPGTTTAIGVASGQLAYIVRNSAARTEVFLVSQATVNAALNATRGVTPRASTAMTDGPVDTDPGGAVAADDALWTLIDHGAQQFAIREMTYPADSSAGARLRSNDHGTVTGPAAIATAADGTHTAVGVATADSVHLVGATDRAVMFTAQAGVDKILPATDATGTLAYLMHGVGGWSVLSVGADGSELRAPRHLPDLPADGDLAQPAYSRGALYTLDKGDGSLYRIGLDGQVEKLGAYPLAVVDGATAEPASLPDGYVVARESRVIFNSGTHANALILFTDGSHPPQRIQKSSAVQVSASGGAEELTRSAVNPGRQTGPDPSDNGPKPRPNPGQVVNTHLDCKNVSQKPHIPIIGPLQAGSRSVTLSWTYPIIDKTQDCYPTTYVVEVKLLSANAPQPPGSVTVESQTGATITGLFPNSRYEFAVTAYIHGQGTASAPFQVRTGPEGPAAPTDLTVAADSAGNWVLDWNSCGSVQQGCVPAQGWTVTPSVCDGRGLSDPPTPMNAAADPTSRKQPTVRYRGGDALLGRGLQFVVTGSGESQVQGTPSAKSACVYSWSPAIPEAMQLSASQPANTALGGSTTTNVTLDLGDNPVRNVGGVGAEVTFTLSGDGKTQSKQATFGGNESNLSVDFGGIEAGAAYTAAATVRPAHGGSAVSIPSVEVSTRAEWPDVSLAGECPKSGLLTCELSVQIRGISSAQARGERFDFDGALTCDSAPALSYPISRSNFDPADPIDAGSVNTLLYHGNGCQVQGTLRENQGSPDPQVFGGKPLDLPAASVNLGAPPTAGAGQDDFEVAWGTARSNGDTPVTITYTGSDNLGQLTENWSETVTPPGGGGCGPSANDVPDSTLWVSTECIADTGSGGGSWTVQISYAERSTDQRQGPFTYTLPNPVPGYQYCQPAGFQATWGATKADGVTVNAGGGELAGCSGWSYELLSQPPDGSAHTCGTASGDPPATVELSPLCLDDPAQGSWTVVVSWRDSADRSQTSDPIAVGGTPPTS